MSHRRIRVLGIQRGEVDVDKLALAYWLMAKREAEERRRQSQETTQKARRARRQP